jgi:nucleotide-binding universal stress UspA family protein
MTVLASRQDRPQIAKRSAAISIRNVLYATDFSTTSEAALPYATAICHRFGSTLHIVHVLNDTNLLLMAGAVDYVSFETLYNDAESMARDKVEQVAAGLREIPNRTYMRHGKVWTNLKSIVSENAIDLIIVGTHGRTGLGKLLLGSVAEDILRHAPCPVLTVGPRVDGRAKLPSFRGDGLGLSPAELELQNMLYATNFTPASLGVASNAISLAQEFGARLTLMHVIEEYSKLEDRPGPIESGVQRLQAILPKNIELAHAPEVVLEFGPAWQCIVNKAADGDADLIVLGAGPVDGSTRMPWSTVHRVVASATCPVLTVPNEAQRL